MPTRKRTTKTPARRRRRSTGLGKITKASVMNAVKASVEGAAGGAAFGFASNLIPVTWGDVETKAAKVGLIVLTDAVLKRKTLAAGMAGAFGAELAGELGLADSYSPARSLPSPDTYALSDGYDYAGLSDGSIYAGYSPTYN